MFNIHDINTVACTDVIISYLRYAFTNITPAKYRWDKDSSKARVIIGGGEVFGLECPGKMHKIAVVRADYMMQHATIDQRTPGDIGGNMTAPAKNILGDKSYSDLMLGTISVVVEGQMGDEVTGLATFCGYMVNATRHKIIKEAGFLHNLRLRTVTAERTVDMTAKPIRLQVAAIFDAPLKTCWVTSPKYTQRFNHFILEHMDEPMWDSRCSYNADSKILIDSTAEFGYFNNNRPQFSEIDLNKKWYKVRLKDSGRELKIINVMDTTRLELQSEISDSAGADIAYDIIYNSMYFEVIPKNENQ